MKIHPISNIYNRNSRLNKNNINRHANPVYFGFSGNSKTPQSIITLLKNFALQLGTMGFSSLLALKGGQNDDKKRDLFLEISKDSDIIDIDLFYKLYDKEPHLVEALANTKRPWNESLIKELYNLEREEPITESEALAIQAIAETADGKNDYIFSWEDIVVVAEDIKDNEIEGVLKYGEELKQFFAKAPDNIPKSACSPDTYLKLAEIFLNGKNVTADELEQYYYEIDDFSKTEKLKEWFNGEPEIREKIFKSLEDKPALKGILKAHPSKITPNKNLLEKLRTINTSRFSLSKILGPYDNNIGVYGTSLINNQVKNSDINSGIIRFNKLPKNIQEHISGSYLATRILLLDTNVENDKDKEKYINLAKFLTDLEETELLESKTFINKAAALSPKEQYSLKSNINWLNDIRSSHYIINEHVLIPLLFESDFEKFYFAANNALKNSDRIKNGLKLKCTNTNPSFVDIAMQFIKKEQFSLADLMNTPKVSIDNIINNLFHISKIQVAIAKNPEKYLPEDHHIPEAYLSCVEEYLKLYLQDTEAAENYFAKAGYPDKTYIAMAKFHLLFTPETIRKYFNAISNTDAEYISMILDKGVQQSDDFFDVIENIPYNIRCHICDLLKNAKTTNKKGNYVKLSGKQKAQIANILPLLSNLEKNELNDLIEKHKKGYIGKNGYIFQLDNFIKDCNRVVLKNWGCKDEKIQEDFIKKIDAKYLYLLNTKEVKNNDDISLFVNLCMKNSVKEYINNPSTPHGKSNLQTEQIFKQNKLDFEVWTEGIGEEIIFHNGEMFTIDLLGRTDLNNLFMNNYTNSCSAIGKTHGTSIPTYLLNTCFNVLGIKNSDGEIVATSRMMIAKNNESPILIIDNIEASNDLKRTLVNDDFVNQVIDYVKEFAKNLSNKPLKVFMTEDNQKIELPDFKGIYKKIQLLGQVTSPSVYLNFCSEDVNPNLKFIEKFLIID